ncbi:MAG: DMT family transporter, partial [SAR324 cluster bacterium]|nr:DMT family transporter [SAR324 cluster bacterium]
RWVFLRGLILVIASLSIGHALRLMPVGETISILYSFPISVMIMSIPLMGEQVSAINLGFATLGFAGVLMVARPGGDLETLGVTFALLTALLAATLHLMTRVLTKTETSYALLFYSILISLPCSGLLALLTWEGYFPNMLDLGLIALLGIIINAAHYLFAVAYRYAPATLIAPANWVHVVWAALFSWLFFDHLPDQWTILGMVVIVAAGVGIAIKSHRENSNRPTGSSVSQDLRRTKI